MEYCSLFSTNNLKLMTIHNTLSSFVFFCLLLTKFEKVSTIILEHQKDKYLIFYEDFLPSLASKKQKIFTGFENK